LKLRITKLENNLREEIKKNVQYQQHIRKTDEFARKLAHIIHGFREEGEIQKEEEYRDEISPLEYLAAEVSLLIKGQYTIDPKHSQPKKQIKKAKSEDKNSELNYGFEFDSNNDDDLFDINHPSSVVRSKIQPETQKEEELPARNEDIDKNSSLPPKWTPDDATNFCEICHEMFGWFRWKDHCRHCGKLVCHDCANTLDYVIGYEDVKVLTCNECHTIIQKAKRKKGKVTSIYSGNFMAHKQNPEKAVAHHQLNPKIN